MTDLRTDVAHYTYRVTWSPEDGEYVGSCLELPSLSWLAPDKDRAIGGIERIAAEVAADLVASGEDLPVPLAERPFSGKFVVRVSPDLHRRLSTRAAEQNVSLNRYVAEQLAAAT